MPSGGQAGGRVGSSTATWLLRALCSGQRLKLGQGDQMFEKDWLFLHRTLPRVVLMPGTVMGREGPDSAHGTSPPPGRLLKDPRLSLPEQVLEGVSHLRTTLPPS